jgi:hypothetical protein
MFRVIYIYNTICAVIVLNSEKKLEVVKARVESEFKECKCIRNIHIFGKASMFTYDHKSGKKCLL